MPPARPHSPTGGKGIKGNKWSQEYVITCLSHSSLSFAVWLLDDYTQKEPLGEVWVSLKRKDGKKEDGKDVGGKKKDGKEVGVKEEDGKEIDGKEEYIKSVKNPSGYHTYSDLPPGTYTLSVESEFYFPEEREFSLESFSDSKEPVIEIVLKPKPSYPFPERATLVRGMLAPGGSLPADVKIKVKDRNSQCIPDESGEFVLYFKEIVKSGEEITIEVEYDGTKKILKSTLDEGHSIYIGFVPLF